MGRWILKTAPPLQLETREHYLALNFTELRKGAVDFFRSSLSQLIWKVVFFCHKGNILPPTTATKQLESFFFLHGIQLQAQFASDEHSAEDEIKKQDGKVALGVSALETDLGIEQNRLFSFIFHNLFGVMSIHLRNDQLLWCSPGFSSTGFWPIAGLEGCWSGRKSDEPEEQGTRRCHVPFVLLLRDCFMKNWISWVIVVPLTIFNIESSWAFLHSNPFFYWFWYLFGPQDLHVASQTTSWSSLNLCDREKLNIESPSLCSEPRFTWPWSGTPGEHRQEMNFLKRIDRVDGLKQPRVHHVHRSC